MKTVYIFGKDKNIVESFWKNMLHNSKHDDIEKIIRNFSAMEFVKTDGTRVIAKVITHPDIIRGIRCNEIFVQKGMDVESWINMNLCLLPDPETGKYLEFQWFE